MLNAEVDLLAAHEDLISIFQSAADTTSDLIAIEDCPTQELASVLHISQVMLGRAQEQTLAAIELFFSGHWAAFEALSRISLEYSIRFTALMKDDPKVTLGKYLGEHFREMEKRQKQMHDALVRTNDKTALQELEQAKNHLRLREDIVNGYATFCGFQLSSKPQRDSTLDYFRTAGKLQLYRGLYSVLSSQVHADAESLIDYIVTHCIQRTDKEKEIANLEVYHWMLHYLTNLIGSYIEACENFASRFMFEMMFDRLQEIRNRFVEIENNYNTKFQEFRTNNDNL